MCCEAEALKKRFVRFRMRHNMHLKKQQREKDEEIHRKRFKELEKIKVNHSQNLEDTSDLKCKILEWVRGRTLIT